MANTIIRNLQGYTAGSFMLGRFLTIMLPIVFWKNFIEQEIMFLLNESVLFDKYIHILYEVGERNISKARETKIRKREKEDIDFADLFSDILQEVKESDFLNGLNDQGWKISFDWIFHNDTNYLKILEGNYRNNLEATKKTGTASAIDRFFGEQETIYAEVEPCKN